MTTSDLFEKSMRALELPLILERLADCAASDAAKERSRALRPMTDAEDVVRLLNETDAAREQILLRGRPGFSGLKPVHEELARAERGGMLSTRELLTIAGLLRCTRLVREYRHDDDENSSPALDRMFYGLRPNKFLEGKITSTVLSEDEIADNASPELLEIRRHKRSAAAKGRQILQKIISSPSYARALQESLITQRDGRFVVPVKAEHRGDIPGLIHDISSSGATLFVEPMGVVQANNELKELEAKEEKEIDRILFELSADAAGFREDILWNYDLLTQLDMIFARGELSCRMNAVRPQIRSDSAVELHKARHPLLDPKIAVPVEISLGISFDTLIITGPNTGGKTVSIKTLGLLCLMAQCGLHIPAGEGSSVGVYEKIFADIGDEQSIEQSLSTFSAHMSNIVRILEEAETGTLALFDELGAGTDPVEGAALAVAIIEHSRRRGVKIAATTHYTELKSYAMTTAGVENASCAFNVETLRPTYQLQIGLPGKSNAFAIAQRLGLSDSVIETARAQMNSENIRFEDILQELEKKRQILENEKAEMDRLFAQREADAKAARAYREQMERAKENARTQGEAEARQILEEARVAADLVFAELDRLRKQPKGDAETVQQSNDSRAEIMRTLRTAREALHTREQYEEPKAATRPIEVGDTVEIPGTNRRGEVLSIKDGFLQLRAGSFTLRVRTEEVRLIESGGKKQQPSAGKQMPSGKQTAQRSLRLDVCPMEVDLRGMESIEAQSVLERYIDSAVLAHLESVRIIHGKGTGVLRAMVQKLLRSHPAVKGFRLGRYGEGENGVTIAELK